MLGSLARGMKEKHKLFPEQLHPLAHRQESVYSVAIEIDGEWVSYIPLTTTTSTSHTM